jgi:hypothetical protein
MLKNDEIGTNMKTTIVETINKSRMGVAVARVVVTYNAAVYRNMFSLPLASYTHCA